MFNESGLVPVVVVFSVVVVVVESVIFKVSNVALGPPMPSDH